MYRYGTIDKPVIRSAPGITIVPEPLGMTAKEAFFVMLWDMCRIVWWHLTKAKKVAKEQGVLAVSIYDLSFD